MKYSFFIFLFVLGSIAMGLGSCTGNKSSSTVTQDEVQLLEARDFYRRRSEMVNVQMIDVRTPEEFEEGHIEKARNINFYDEDFAGQIEKLNKNNPVMVYCQAGGRSSKAAERFRQAGFKQVYDLKGGMLSWKKEKLPTSNPPVEDFFAEDLDSLLSGHELVVIDFYAHWCGPCRRIEPILEEIAAEFKGKVQYERVNVDYISGDLASELDIDEIPVVVAFKNGKEVARLIGEEHTKNDFRKLFQMKP